MSESAENKCIHPDAHSLHICQLKKTGMVAEIAARSNDPGYICHNCNAVANRAEDLCNCSPIRKKV